MSENRSPVESRAERKRPLAAGLVRPMGLVALLLAGAAGCATRPLPASGDLAKSTDALRAQNAAYVRRIEELENQVFVLNAEIENRRAPAPAPAPVAPPPVALPEVKLARGEKPPQPVEASDGPRSLVDDAEIEYSGAAADRGGKRPVLRLWGSGADSGASEAVAQPEVNTPAPRPASLRARATDETALDDRDGASPALALYRSGLEHLRSGQHDEAVAAFRAFIARYPSHDYADNAQYWLGECFYDHKDYSMAVREFRRVIEKFPHGNKVPDALLKIGFSYIALGSARPGREALAELTRNYPHHPAAALAVAKLAELDGPALGPHAANAPQEIR